MAAFHRCCRLDRFNLSIFALAAGCLLIQAEPAAAAAKPIVIAAISDYKLFDQPAGTLNKKPATRAKRAVKSRKPAAVPVVPAAPDNLAISAAADLMENGRKISAGPFVAYVRAENFGDTATAGASAFIDILVTAAPDNKAKAVAIDLAADGGEVVQVTHAKGAQLVSSAAGKRALVPLGAGGKVVLQVEYKLKRADDGKAENRLRVTLVDPANGASEQATMALAWLVADCAGDYHQGLQQIVSSNNGAEKLAYDAARLVDGGFPGAWIFAPKGVPLPAKAKGKIACANPVKTLNKKRRLVLTCPVPVIEETVALASTVPEPPQGMPAKAILALASDYVKAKGAVAALQKKGRYERLVYNIARDLNNFMSQPEHPALCSGTDFMVDYFEGFSKRFRDDIATVVSARAAARDHAAYRIDRLAEAVKAAPIAVASTAAVIALPGQHEGQPMALIAEVAKLVLPDADQAAVKASAGPIAALKSMKELMATGSGAVVSGDVKARAADALSMIEAMIYLDGGTERLTAVDQAVFGNFSKIRDAHKKACVCTE